MADNENNDNTATHETPLRGPLVGKDYANPLAECERGLAATLRATLPSSVAVFAGTDEGAEAELARTIAQGTAQSVTVELVELTEVTHAQLGATFDALTSADAVSYRASALASFRISVRAAALLSSSQIAATTDLGFTVLRALDGALFSHPLLTALEFTGWEQTTEENIFTSTLTFTAHVGLLEILR